MAGVSMYRRLAGEHPSNFTAALMLGCRGAPAWNHSVAVKFFTVCSSGPTFGFPDSPMPDWFRRQHQYLLRPILVSIIYAAVSIYI